MWKHRIAYALLWLITFLLYIFYVGYISWYLFVIVCSLPIFSITYVLLAKHTIFISMHCEQEQYERGNTMKVIVETRMRSFFPVAKIQGELQIINHLTKTMHVSDIAFATAHTQQIYEIEEELSASGKYSVSLCHVKVYDVLGLIGFSMKSNAQCSLYCFPTPQPCAFELPETTMQMETRYDPNRKGNDRSETFDIRAYQPGDSLHAVHWKLSAKMDDLMVREFASPMQDIATLCFDLYGSQEDVEMVLSNLYGGSIYLLMHEQPHDMIQYNKGAICLQKHIQNRQMLDRVMRSILDFDGDVDEVSSLSNLPTSLLHYYVRKDGINNPMAKGEPHHV